MNIKVSALWLTAYRSFNGALIIIIIIQIIQTNEAKNLILKE